MKEFELISMSTCFKQKRKRSTGTWMDRNGYTHQIDHIFVNKRFASSVRSSKLNWGVSIQRYGYKHDHCAIILELKLRFKKQYKSQNIYNRNKLVNPSLINEYNQKINCRMNNKTDIINTNNELEEYEYKYEQNENNNVINTRNNNQKWLKFKDTMLDI